MYVMYVCIIYMYNYCIYNMCTHANAYLHLSLFTFLCLSTYLACLCACVYSVQILIAQSLIFARSKSQGPPDENV